MIYSGLTTLTPLPLRMNIPINILKYASSEVDLRAVSVTEEPMIQLLRTYIDEGLTSIPPSPMATWLQETLVESRGEEKVIGMLRAHKISNPHPPS